ncbi:MAG: acyltransferase [Clostridia bacterium]|nr:acyltransferase [Clostridia bacterium]
MTKERNSSIELLRIISMILIIFHHISFHGFSVYADASLFSLIWAKFIKIGGKIGVDVFVIISGYFLIGDNAPSFKIVRKSLKLILQILFYSIVFYILFEAIVNKTFNINECIKYLMPISNSKWWFATDYFILFLLHPFINCMLLSFNKSTYKKFLLILFVILCIIPTVFATEYLPDSSLWFVFLYSTAAYFKLYGFPKVAPQFCLLLSAGLYIIKAILYLGIIKFNSSNPNLDNRASAFCNHNNLLIFIISLLLFLGFSQIQIKTNKIINTVASTTFGIYLIHDNCFVRPFLWKTVFKISEHESTLFFIPYTFFIVIVVFTVCSLIEFARINTIEKYSLKIYDKYLSPKVYTIAQKISSNLK